MKLAVFAFTSLALIAQPQAAAPGPSAECWPALWARVPAPLKADLAKVAPAPGGKPPMEILMRTAGAKGQVLDEQNSAPGITQMLRRPDGRIIYYGRTVDVYSRLQAKNLAESMISPAGEPLAFSALVPGSFLDRGGMVTNDLVGGIVTTDAHQVRWTLRYRVVGPTPAGRWEEEAGYSPDCRKLQAAILAGDWPKAFDARTREAVRKTSPDEPLLAALEILATLDQPAGKAALVKAIPITSSRLSLNTGMRL